MLRKIWIILMLTTTLCMGSEFFEIQDTLIRKDRIIAVMVRRHLSLGGRAGVIVMLDNSTNNKYPLTISCASITEAEEVYAKLVKVLTSKE